MASPTGAASPLPAPGGGSFFSRHPFLTGIFGGFLGSMLFGRRLFRPFSGGLFTLLIIWRSIFFVIRLFSGRGFSVAGAGGGMPRSVGAAAAPAQQRYRGRDITVAERDLNAFQATPCGDPGSLGQRRSRPACAS